MLLRLLTTFEPYEAYKHLTRSSAAVRLFPDGGAYGGIGSLKPALSLAPPGLELESHPIISLWESSLGALSFTFSTRTVEPEEGIYCSSNFTTSTS